MPGLGRNDVSIGIKYGQSETCAGTAHHERRMLLPLALANGMHPIRRKRVNGVRQCDEIVHYQKFAQLQLLLKLGYREIEVAVSKLNFVVLNASSHRNGTILAMCEPVTHLKQKFERIDDILIRNGDLDVGELAGTERRSDPCCRASNIGH